MELFSVNTGLPRNFEWQGEMIKSSIFKTAVPGSVKVNKLNLEGDRQSDLTVHGGVDKAIYVYPYEHYKFWHEELPEIILAPGAFGENLTTIGLSEENVNIGDEIRIGTCVFKVTQPRFPCFKLVIRFGRPDIVKKFLQCGRTGFYMSVVKEGEVLKGNTIEISSEDSERVKVADIVELYKGKIPNKLLLQKVSNLTSLPESLKVYFREKSI